jgi:hypothetical protein
LWYGCPYGAEVEYCWYSGPYVLLLLFMDSVPNSETVKMENLTLRILLDNSHVALVRHKHPILHNLEFDYRKSLVSKVHDCRGDVSRVETMPVTSNIPVILRATKVKVNCRT